MKSLSAKMKKAYLENLIVSSGPISAGNVSNLTKKEHVLLTFAEMKELAKEHDDVFIIVEGRTEDYIDTRRYLNQKTYSV